MKELNPPEICSTTSISILNLEQKRLIRSESAFCLWLSELMSKSLGHFIDNTPLDGDVFSLSEEMINCFGLLKDGNDIIIGLPREMTEWFIHIHLKKCTVVKDKLYISLIVEGDAFFIALPINVCVKQFESAKSCSFGVISKEQIHPIADSISIPFSIKNIPLNLV